MGVHTPFTPSAVHEGLFDSQLACYLLPVLRLLFPPRQKPLLLSSLLGGERAAICGHVHWSRTLIPLTAYPCGLARIMRGGRCMHAWLEEDVIQWIDTMLQGRTMWYGWWFRLRSGGVFG